jgi:WD40 repeat protein/serine/threonine protein kinase
MGAVYLAKDERLDRTVALKETFYSDNKLRRAFEQEARLLASLDHGALTPVFDHFVEGDGQFLIMKYIPGDDLETLLKENGRPFLLSEVLSWADELLDALEFLHGHRPPIIHRDIKPSNLKLTQQGRVILLDFGLAKGLANGQSLTCESVPAASLYYSPLEQFHGTSTGTYSDLFSLSATLYHLLTGVRPTTAPERFEEIRSGRQDPLILPWKLNSRVTPAISDLLLSALSLYPEHRPSSATEFRRALRVAGSLVPLNYRSDSGSEEVKRLLPRDGTESQLTAINEVDELTRASQIPAPPRQSPCSARVERLPSRVSITDYLDRDAETHADETTVLLRPSPSRNAVVPGLICLLLVITAVALLYNSSRLSGNNRLANEVWVLKGELSGGGKSVAFSPDATRLAGGRYENGITLWDARTNFPERTLPTYNNVTSVAFSPDGNVLAGGEWGHRVELWDVQKGSLVRIISSSNNVVESVAFSPDGKTLACAGTPAGKSGMDGKVELWDVQTGELKQTFGAKEKGFTSVAFSPDGQVIACGSVNSVVYLWDVRAGTLLRTLTGHSKIVDSVAFSPDGRMLASGSVDLTIRIWDAQTGALLRKLVGHSLEVESVVFSHDGRILASGSDDKTVRIWDVQTGALLQVLPVHEDYVQAVDFSPNDRMLASGSYNGKTLIWNITEGR